VDDDKEVQCFQVSVVSDGEIEFRHATYFILFLFYNISASRQEQGTINPNGALMTTISAVTSHLNPTFPARPYRQGAGALAIWAFQGYLD
jgi:hypothetical protein